MSLKDLSKEQKQYVALGLLAAAILVNLLVLGIRFSMATVSAAKEELDDLTAKISNANQSLSRSRQTSEDYITTVEVLKEYLKNAPPERNYYSWATQVIYSKARFADLEIDSIDEITMPQRQRSGPDDATELSFESYSLRILAHGGYENTKYFLNLLKQDYPLVRFSGVEISSGQSAEKHDVQLFMQWPFNFGEIAKNWDAVASKKMKVAALSEGQKVASPKESELEDTPATPAAPAAKPDPVREPHPPTSPPKAEETSAPKPAVQPTAAKAPSGMDVRPHAGSLSTDSAPKPATDDEIQAILSNAAIPADEQMGSERQRTFTEPESIVQPQPVRELETSAPEPEPVLESAIMPDSAVEPQSVAELAPAQEPESVIEQEPLLMAESQTPPVLNADTDPMSLIEQEIFPLSNVVEKNDSPSIPAEPASYTTVAVSQINLSSAPDADPASESVVESSTASVSEAPRNYVSTGKSEKLLEELLNKGSSREDASLSSFLDGLVGEINEK